MSLVISRFVFGPWLAGLVFLVIALWATLPQVLSATGWDKVIGLNRLCFAVPLAVFGAQHLVGAIFVAQMVPPWMPVRLFWAYFVGVALFAAALSILVKIQVQMSSTLLGIMIFLFVAMLHLPNAITHPRDRIIWAVAFRDLTFAVGAWSLAGTQSEKWQTQGRSWLATLGRYVLGGVALFFAVEHFLHPEFAPGVPLAKVTPTWIPARLAVSYLTGIVLAGGGLCLLLGKKTRAAATAIGVMILFLLLYVYLPILIALPGDIANGLNYFADTMMFAGAVLLVAEAMPSEPKK